ncbi:glucose-6-phosphate isomerase [Plasmodium falciparum Palo Alto/Uganda]|uniref:Glucose-6-phosphate isomerase n=8 Tax=Plasmodium falciparum TaxID=5833 RepID=Q8ILA4_PLAF7|nr:glucose-6-phosphate isomerase [Plasmodium falciparum 3D7]ETW16152.1 glucose-6-phosphate isomerase [Plasmodium falciparum Vietnam Oak-Knoll (FVO)]ETW33961.1 glucose-6-phosphate isomerase [Plasmodium falciparum Tanzania (2000708)]ETW54004.1 glucose-6-phosphate isomerase [Plasmodium falciparum Palo Alto/Uganda]ETW58312.1 glucose-6-phosphate isomerase [Plasmodium falciparum CAMP/Malaysia]EUR62803.1 glucose-6-phosphate isomerase [Plasmodium falciparum 7G8]EWC85724.1 glucose-6-phosphate isomeras|eukprot:XP_001348515.1 glucose-6-phosphate isomerase [Plasmodium falciparum 3D7]
MNMEITNLKSYKELVTLSAEEKTKDLKDYLNDKNRSESLIKKFKNFYMDLSRQRYSEKTLNKLVEYAEEVELKKKVEKTFMGEKVNMTENRSVLHTALRIPIEKINTHKIIIDNKNVLEDVHGVLKKIEKYSDDIRNGVIKTCKNTKFKNVICIGIGGSYLGTEFVYEAMKYYYYNMELNKNEKDQVNNFNNNYDQDNVFNVRFLANVDPNDVNRAIQNLDQYDTLVIIISKTFTTAETMLNARSIKKWLSLKIKDDENLSKHMVAVSTNLKLTDEFGISRDNVFEFWDWVGGRFSVTSSVGILPLSIAFGYKNMRNFLNGCHDMDEHFLHADLKENIPVLLALTSFYNSHFFDYKNVAILPYFQNLLKFSAHIQQLSMESNGKSVDRNNQPIHYNTCQVYFGEPGTNGQHSFYQLIHQGQVIPVELIGFKHSHFPIKFDKEVVSNHDELMTNFFAQADALAIGKTYEQVKEENEKNKMSPELLTHKVFNGNRPSTLLLFDELNFYTCGLLLSLYESRIVAEGFLLNINSFDQWGVELGKVLAKEVRNYFNDTRNQKKSDNTYNFNESTKILLNYYLSK